ncbi:MAG: hypothetical protein PV362_11415 [Providencia heimbachae]|nr:hypothetical protein [Providencia heimbachae]
MVSSDKFKQLQRDYDSAMLSYNTSKYVSIVAIAGAILGFFFPNNQTVLLIFVVIGFIFYFFYCREKLSKAERDMDHMCQKLFGKKYIYSKNDLIIYSNNKDL